MGSLIQMGTWTLTAEELNDLTLTLPEAVVSAGNDFDITVTAIATEADGSDSVAQTATINVDLVAATNADEVSGSTFIGGATADIFFGSDDAATHEVFYGAGGNDIIITGDGTATVDAGAGDDVVFNGAAASTLNRW